MVVAGSVLCVHHDGDAVALLKIKERLFHVAHDDHDLLNAGRMELLYETLDEHLAVHLEHGLGTLERERGDARAHASRQNDGVAYAIGGQGGLGRSRGLPCLVQQTGSLKLVHRLVHRAQRNPCFLGNSPLRGAGVGLPHPKRLEFIARQHE